MIKISVIIPVFNMGAYLEQCLRSVMAQTLKEIEVICVNDGSTDDSSAILQKFRSLYPNLMVLDQSNGGVAASRNRAMSIAQGEFVAFMDADDGYPMQDVLECLYRSAKENHAPICGGSLSRMVGQEQITAFSPRDRDYTFSSTQMVRFRDYQFVYGFQRFIYQTAFLREYNLVFPAYAYFEDPPFLANVLSRAETFYAIPKVTYTYRLKPNKTPLSLSKTIDYAAGLLDIMTLSSKMRLSKLHAKMTEALHDDLSPAIYRYTSRKNEQLQELVARINRAMDRSLLQEEAIDIHSVYLLEGETLTRYIDQVLANGKAFMETLRTQEKIIIFGAGNVGTETANYVQSLEGVEVVGFAVSQGMNNPSWVNGLKVNVIDELISYKNSALILIATYPYLHQEIHNKLAELGFRHVLPINYNELQLCGVLS